MIFRRGYTQFQLLQIQMQFTDQPDVVVKNSQRHLLRRRKYLKNQAWKFM